MEQEYVRSPARENECIGKFWEALFAGGKPPAEVDFGGKGGVFESMSGKNRAKLVYW